MVLYIIGGNLVILTSPRCTTEPIIAINKNYMVQVLEFIPEPERCGCGTQTLVWSLMIAAAVFFALLNCAIYCSDDEVDELKTKPE